MRRVLPWGPLRDQLSRYALSLTHDPWLAEDLVQTTLIRGLERQHRLSEMPEGQVTAYLFKTLKNALIDHLRKQGREQLPGELPEVGIEEDFTGLIAQEALEGLPQNLRTLVRLRHEMDYNSSEIAIEMGMPAATVRTQLRAARLLLQKKGGDRI